MSAPAASDLRFPPIQVLASPAAAFDAVREQPRIRALLAWHVGSYLVLVAALSPGLTSTAREWTGNGAAAGALPVAWAFTAFVVFLTLVVCLVAAGFGAFLLHLTARLAGGRAGGAATVSTYLLASAPLWVRNLVLAAAFVLLDDQALRARLGAMRLVDPFVVATAVLLVVGLRRVHRLGWVGACCCALVSVAGGQLLASGPLL